MGAYKNRLAGYFVLGLALALAVPPWFFPDSKKEWLTRQGVFLSALGLNRPALATACGDHQICELTTGELDKYPDIKKVLVRLLKTDPPGVKVYFDSSDPKAMARNLGREKAGRICFSLDGDTYLLRPTPKNSVIESWMVQVGVSSETAFAQQTLTTDESKRYPFLNIYLDALNDPHNRERFLSKDPFSGCL